MFDKDNKNKKTKKVVAASHKKEDHIHISDLDDGEFAFMEWLNSENKTSKNHIILKRYTFII